VVFGPGLVGFRDVRELALDSSMHNCRSVASWFCHGEVLAR
jgi:hypothetical protein